MQPAEDDRDRPSPDWRLPPEPPVHRAARKGDLSTLERLVTVGADINELADLEFDNGPHLRGLTPLMVAARSIDGATVETLRWLVERGGDLNAESEGGDTVAWYAAGHGARWAFHTKTVTPDHVRRLEFLLDTGLNPRECNFIGRSLLTEACEAGDAARVKLLLARGADPTPDNPTSRGASAIKRWKKRLTLHRARDDESDQPCGKRDAFQVPIFCAARSGSAECVKCLLDAKADPNERDSSASTPLMGAGSPEVVRLLLDAGADLHSIDQFGDDALEAVLERSCCGGACSPDRFRVARALLESGANLERVDEFGKTRLASAAFGHHDDAVAFLLELGADPRARDSDGDTALHAICWQGEYEDPATNSACARIIETLVAAGIDPDARSKAGATAMHDAAGGDWGNPTAIRTLLRFGANPDSADRNGDVPLMEAASKGEVECIRVLLGAGANAARRNREGSTVLDLAEEHLKSWEDIATGPHDEELEATLREIREIHESVKVDTTETFGSTSTAGTDAKDEEVERHREALVEAREAFRLISEAVVDDDAKGPTSGESPSTGGVGRRFRR